MSKSITNLKISVSGVRGVVGETLTPRLISSFTAAFGQYVGAGRVVVGRDTRKTGQMVEQAVIAGLLSVGCQPVLCDVLPTPSIQIMVSHLNAVGGIAITASHNPMSWNAMKFINSNGMFLNNTEAREMLDIYNQEHINNALEEQCRKIKTYENAFAIHQQKVLDNIDVEVIKKRKFKVAIDCCNGAGAPYGKAFLEALGCEVVAIHTKTDGIFERPPEPTPDALTALEKVVVEEKCDIGFAQDPDADRLVLVDDNGRALNENYTLALATLHLTKGSDAPVCINLATSKMIEDICKSVGSEVRYTKIGEINVSTDMMRCGAIIRGEAHGGVIWPKIHPCRDSFGGMALILELLAQQNKS
ncbi:MAG: phosphoglucosamine mutase, partial [Lentisphaeraceae bacterium]|nr:phosphoglucosamine mutase [Lentisphaeraceae bacterium]